MYYCTTVSTIIIIVYQLFFFHMQIPCFTYAYTIYITCIYNMLLSFIDMYIQSESPITFYNAFIQILIFLGTLGFLSIPEEHNIIIHSNLFVPSVMWRYELFFINIMSIYCELLTNIYCWKYWCILSEVQTSSFWVIKLHMTMIIYSLCIGFISDIKYNMWF